MKKIGYFIYLVLFFSIGCSTIQPTMQKEKDSMSAIIEDFEKIGEVLDQAFPSIWPNLSDEKRQKEKAALSSIKERLDKIATQALTESDKINADILSLIINDRLFHIDFESHLFPLNSEGGFLAGIVYGIQNMRLKDEEAYGKFKERLQTLPNYLTTRKAQMQLGQEKGKSSPKVVVENCIKLIDGWLSTSKEELFYLNPVRDNKTRIIEITQLIDEAIIPAYKAFKAFLKTDYLPKAPDKVGISEINNGKTFYEQRVRFFTTSESTPAEIFQIGQQEVKRIKAEMDQIIEDLGFEGSFADFLAFLRTDEQFYPKTPKALLQQAAWITKEMEGKLPRYFGKLPRMPLTVKPVPAALAPNYTGGRYSPGSYKDNRAGQYWVNTYKLDSRPYYVLPALSLHEGVPGHHLQNMLAAEMDDMPKFRQRTYLSAFGEGWGLYSEYLGKEAGMYKTPYEDFGRLTYEMWRACRLVVDPGIHYKGWTRAEAVDFMAKNTALSLHEVNTEIDRYIGWPGQAVSYKMGELKIRELRKIVETAQGEQFDIRAFHDLVLANGSVPLSTLERIVLQQFNIKN